MKKGYVYILSNQYMPGIIKIGRTAKSPKERLRALSKPSGIPVAFKVEYAVYSVDSISLEKLIHMELWMFKINPQREFFKIDIESAKTILRDRHKKLSKKYITKSDGLNE